MNDSDRDRACLVRLREGDQRALEELYDRYADLLYSIAIRIVRGAPEAEEVVQETWVQAWRKAASFDSDRGSVGAWLVTIARSRALDRLRSMGSRLRAETAAGAELQAETAMPTTADASAQATHRQLSATVVSALAQLGDQQRRVLELAYFQGLSQTEIADQLATPLGTVKSWTRQALMRLRELVPQEEWS